MGHTGNRRQLRVRAALGALWLLHMGALQAGPASVEGDGAPVPPVELELGVISGAVSLGAYQAGFLEYYSRYRDDLLDAQWKSGPPPARLPISKYAGASAGSINALLRGLRQCYQPESNVEEELFFSLWTHISLPNMLREGQPESNGLVEGQALEALLNRVATEWEGKKSWRPCHFAFGATVTRLEPRPISINADLQQTTGAEIPRVTEKFLIEVEGGGSSMPQIRAIRFEPPGPGRAGQQDMFLALASREGALAALTVRDLLTLARASAGFPVAFPPTLVPHLSYALGSEQATYTQNVPFVDGGILNNNPMDLLVYMEQWDRSAPEAEKYQQILYLDQDIKAKAGTNSAGVKTGQSSRAERRCAAAREKSLLCTYAPLLGGVVEAGTSSQMLSTFEQNPEYRDRVVAPLRTGVLAGQFLVATSAFFDRSFAIYDFYRGMRDAKTYLAGLELRAEALEKETLEKQALGKQPGSAGDVQSGRGRFPLVSLWDLLRGKSSSSRPGEAGRGGALESSAFGGHLRRTEQLSLGSQRFLCLEEALVDTADPKKAPARWLEPEKKDACKPLLLEQDPIRLQENLNYLALIRSMYWLEKTTVRPEERTFRKMLKALDEDERRLRWKARADLSRKPFRTLEMRSVARPLAPSQSLSAMQLRSELRRQADVELEALIALQPRFQERFLLERVGDVALNESLEWLPDQQSVALGSASEGPLLRVEGSPFSLRRWRANAGLELKVGRRAASAGSEHFYHRGDVALGVGVSCLPLLFDQDFGQWLFKRSELLHSVALVTDLSLSLGLWGQLGLFGSPETLWTVSDALGDWAVYPGVEIGLKVLDSIQIFGRARLPTLAGELSMPINDTPVLAPIQGWEWGVLLHW